MRIDTRAAAARSLPASPPSRGDRNASPDDDVWHVLVDMRQTFRGLMQECASSWPMDDASPTAPARQRMAQRLVAEWAVYLSIEDRLLLPRLARAGAQAPALRAVEKSGAILQGLIEGLIAHDRGPEALALRVELLGRLLDQHLRQVLVQLLGPMARAGADLEGLGAELSVARNDLLAELADQTDARRAARPSA